MSYSVKKQAPVIAGCLNITVTDSYGTVLSIDTGNGAYGVALTMHEENTHNILYEIFAGNYNDITKCPLLSGVDMPLGQNGTVNEQISKGFGYVFVQAKNALAGQAGKISIAPTLVE